MNTRKWYFQKPTHSGWIKCHCGDCLAEAGQRGPVGVKPEDTASAAFDRQRQRETLTSPSSHPPVFCWPKLQEAGCQGCFKNGISCDWQYSSRREENRLLDKPANGQPGLLCSLQHPILGKYQAYSFCAISFAIQLTFSFLFLVFPSDFYNPSPVPCITHRCWSLLWKKSSDQKGMCQGSRPVVKASYTSFGYSFI